MALDLSNIGSLLEGTLELDPMTDRLSLHTWDANGNPTTVDLEEVLKPFLGKEVRLTVASLSALQQLAEHVEKAGGGQVAGVMPEDLQIPYNIARKPD